jgi:hypothetical protein
MLDNPKLIIDTHCEIYSMLKHRADGIFWNFSEHVEKNQLVPGAVYVIGREQARLNPTLIQELMRSNTIKVVYSNPVEGSEPMEWNLFHAGYTEFLTKKSLLVVTGGNINPEYPQLCYDWFLGRVHDYEENLQAIQDYESAQKQDRPYKFLFLNGRMRGHRKYLLRKFQTTGLLEHALWSNLDPSIGVGPLHRINTNTLSEDHTTFPAHYLLPEYEVDRYQDRATKLPDAITHNLEAKNHLFKNEWGEIYLNARAYADTYFSLVTETVFDYPHSFRTEKIWKPIAIGHPFIAVSGQGYYRDLQNLGFKTFGHLIDESFDAIENNQQRIERIVEVVEDLCRQDLPAFITAAEEVCKYNQQLITELRPKIRDEFPGRFFQAINNHFNERFRI